MAPRISALRAHDVRFPTSDFAHGSDAMNPDPDYSAAVAVIETDDPELTGHGMTFTNGRGTELSVGANRASLYANLQPFLGAAFAVLTLGETMGTLQIIGGAVIAAGILLARERRPPVTNID